MTDIIYKQESYKIIGVCMEVHNILGKWFLEIVYKDALEYDFGNLHIPFEREKEYKVQYKDIILPHKFYADFVVFGKIILEIKGTAGITDAHIAQTINYLKVSGCKLGLIVNFGQTSLQYKRVVF